MVDHEYGPAKLGSSALVEGRDREARSVERASSAELDRCCALPVLIRPIALTFADLSLRYEAHCAPSVLRLKQSVVVYRDVRQGCLEIDHINRRLRLSR
jgi:hypothetical protein